MYLINDLLSIVFSYLEWKEWYALHKELDVPLNVKTYLRYDQKGVKWQVKLNTICETTYEKYDYLEIVEYLLEYGALIEFANESTIQYKSDYQIDITCAHGNLNLVKYLHKHDFAIGED